MILLGTALTTKTIIQPLCLKLFMACKLQHSTSFSTILRHCKYHPKVTPNKYSIIWMTFVL